jgi:predicted RNA-binding Zn-ribbon protein involved in translation (DUF1610 family)
VTQDRTTTIEQYSGLPSCPVCGKALVARLARSRKSGQPFVMLKCRREARHYRAFIADKAYVAEVLERLEAGDQTKEGDQP